MQYYNPYFLIATCFGIGKIPFMPGTIGSILAFPISYYCIQVLETIRYNYFPDQNALIFYWAGMLAVTIILFIVGTVASHKYSKAIADEDPKEVVIDEVVGQILTLIFIAPTAIITVKLNHIGMTITPYSGLYPIEIVIIASLLASFILFRIFDIFKPWPINWADKHVKGGLGIMLDDILAGVFSIIVYNTIILKFFG